MGGLKCNALKINSAKIASGKNLIIEFIHTAKAGNKVEYQLLIGKYF